MTFKETTIESSMIYEGAILNLRRDKVMTVSGREAYREIVEHNGGVALAAFTPQRRLVMVEQYRKAAKKVLTEVPAGKRERGEEPEMTALRELREETGYTAGCIEPLGEIFVSPGYCEEKLYLYLCTELIPGETHFDDSEAIDVYEYSFDELMEMISNGGIEDAKTIAAIFLAKRRLEQKGLL